MGGPQEAKQGPEAPTGTVSFLFTDIEGSTKLLELLGESDYGQVLAAHRQILSDAVGINRGYDVDCLGDSFFAAFGSASDCLRAAVQAQLGLQDQIWPGRIRLKVRMGAHTGEAIPRNGQYISSVVHEAARVAAAAHGGEILASEETIGLARNLPEDISSVDLGAHRLRDVAKPIRLFRILHSRLPEDLPTPKTLGRERDNLPKALTTFIGRESEKASVKGHLALHRLITLSGPGGVGKTRLAIEIASDTLGDFEGGAWLVDLSVVVEYEEILNAIAHSLPIHESYGRRDPVQLIVDFLSVRPAVLILDNCEHLVGEISKVVAVLLNDCKDLRILATSREILGIQGEVVFRLHPFPVGTNEEDLAKSAAMHLFRDRALLARADFTPTPGDDESIARICRRLDGIPLAIELAAARVSVLTPREIEERLTRRFKLLTAGGSTGGSRHRTLEATLDWSFQLLASDEQLFLTNLSVFGSDFSIQASEQVAWEESEDEALDVLTRLVDKSLVHSSLTERGTRFSLLETIREYLRDKLIQTGIFGALKDRHLGWCIEHSSKAAAELQKGSESRSLEVFRVELENFRAGLIWALSSGSGLKALLLGVSLAAYWNHTGETEKTRETLGLLLKANEGSESIEVASAHLFIAIAALAEGSPSTALSHLNEALKIAEGQPKYNLEAHGPIHSQVLGFLALLVVSDPETAENYAEQALQLARSSQDRVGLSTALHLEVNRLLLMGSIDRAKSVLDEAIEMTRDGPMVVRAQSLALASHLGREKGDLELARKWAREAVAVARAVPMASAVLEQALRTQGEVASVSNELRVAIESFVELAELLRAKNPAGTSSALAWAAFDAFRIGDEEAGIHMLEDAVNAGRRGGDTNPLRAAVQHLAAVARAVHKDDELYRRLIKLAESLTEADDSKSVAEGLARLFATFPGGIVQEDRQSN